MIGDVVNSPKDLKRMMVLELLKDSVTLVSLDKSETSTRSYDELEPLSFFDDRIFVALGFVDRGIKTSYLGATKVDKIAQLFDKSNSNVFFTLVIDKCGDSEWTVDIQDNNFTTIGSGRFNSVNKLQNIVRACTGLEFTITSL